MAIAIMIVVAAFACCFAAFFHEVIVETFLDLAHEYRRWKAEWRARCVRKRVIRVQTTAAYEARLERIRHLDRLAPALDHEELLYAVGASGFAPEEYPQWRAAYKWSRRARENFNFPKDSAANRIIVADWLRKIMEGEHVRPHDRHTLLPFAVVLTFVRSNAEKEAEEAMELFRSIPGMVEQGAK